jgi:uncharacterized protein (DUF2461 family)
MTEFSGFPEETFRFLRGITKNNDKDWFEAHRGDYSSSFRLGDSSETVAHSVSPARLRERARQRA